MLLSGHRPQKNPLRNSIDYNIEQKRENNESTVNQSDDGEDIPVRKSQKRRQIKKKKATRLRSNSFDAPNRTSLLYEMLESKYDLIEEEEDKDGSAVSSD